MMRRPIDLTGCLVGLSRIDSIRFDSTGLDLTLHVASNRRCKFYLYLVSLDSAATGIANTQNKKIRLSGEPTIAF
jgi:hypothetical protein